MVRSPILYRLMVMANIASATMLVSLTCMESHTIRLDQWRWLAHWNLGPDKYSLQACLLVFVARRSFYLLQFDLPWRKHVVPIVSLCVSLLSVVGAASLKRWLIELSVQESMFVETLDRVIPHFMRIYSLEASVFLLLVKVGGPLIRLIWDVVSNTSFSWTVHVVDVSIRACVWLSTLCLVFCEETDSIATLRAWQLCWMLDAWVLSLVMLMSPRWNSSKTGVRAKQRIAKDLSLVDCVCCYEATPWGEVAICPRGHPTCPKCFQFLFDISLARPRDNLHAEEIKEARYMVMCTSENCGMHFGVKIMTKLLTEHQVERWEKINKDLYKDLHLQQWIREGLEEDPEQKRADEIRKCYRSAVGSYPGVYQCPECKFGPKELVACNNLATHHQQRVTNPRTGQVHRRNNSCERCGWFGRTIEMWDPWDGTVWPAKTIPNWRSSFPSGCFPEHEGCCLLRRIGYSAELIYQGVTSAFRRAVRYGVEFERQVMAAVTLLEGGAFLRQLHKNQNTEPNQNISERQKKRRKYKVPFFWRRKR